MAVLAGRDRTLVVLLGPRREHVEVRDGDLEDVVYEGAVTDAEGIRAHDYTIKVDLEGHLDADREYYYRFYYRETASRIGRCRTLPHPDSSPESMRFAVLACQNYLNGYYPALHYVAEEDVDFVVHVGDFIYESSEGHFKGLGSYDYPGREKDLPSGNGRVWGLEEIRPTERSRTGRRSSPIAAAKSRPPRPD